jgi:dihydropteroate synthase
MCVMGVLNVTPDSFSDGGAFVDPGRAADRAGEMLAQGADLIDIGAESTRPGSAPVAADEQVRRALPVIERIRRERPEAILSLDTRSVEVARVGLDAGVAIVNDVSALRDEPELGRVIAQRGAGVVLMHMRGSPTTMQVNPTYGDVVGEVAAFLAERAAAAQAAGIAREQIIIDPGIGFGKTVEHNLSLLANLERFVSLGFPILLGASRKGFIVKVAGGAAAPVERIGGSLACVARAYAAGVAIVRVHDVWETRQMIEVLTAIGPVSAAPTGLRSSAPSQPRIETPG